MPATLAAELERALGRRPVALRPVPGGDLNEAFAAELDDGERLFVKTSAEAPPGGFAAEAAGLRWLAAADSGLGVPAVVAAGERFLALRWVEASGARPDEEALGRGLARLHVAGAARHGAVPHGDGAPTFIGPLALRNDPAPTYAAFLAERRLLPLADRAEARGALPDGARARLDRVCSRLPDIVGPEEPPARLHGDLWTGNVMAGADGRPWLVDPAAHGGHRETDLAMLRLFGAPGPRFLAAYEEVAPLPPGHEERVGLHQLTPLLVHAVLFGGSYGASADRVARRLVP